MPRPAAGVLRVLQTIESFYGPQQTKWPTDPYLFLLWWHCGYPASDRACNKGWELLNESIGVEPEQILRASPDRLASALKLGGMVPDLRALRLKEIAARIQDQFGGDLRRALSGPLPQARKTLKSFPNIGDPGCDRILLFAGISSVAAVPSNCPHVLVRIAHGCERESYNVTYGEAQRLLQADVPETLEARTRAYLLLKQHGQELCKRANPKCTECPVNKVCAFAHGNHRGRGAPA